MADTTTMPIKRAIVRLTRSHGPLDSRLTGGIHQRVASRRARYPFMVYSEVSAPWFHDLGDGNGSIHREIHALFDISFFSLNQVEAENLDSLAAALFSSSTSDDALQAFLPEQRVLICRRTADMPTGPDRDATGRPVTQIGGTYEIWTDQALSA